MRYLLAGLVLCFAVGCISDERLAVDDPEIEACREWLRNNLDEPRWDEVEWGTPLRDDDRGISICKIKVRTRSPEGGKVLRGFQLFVNTESGTVYHYRELRNR